MTSTEMSMYLVEGVLDQGLGFVAAHLKRLLNKNIIIIDNTGHIHYPNNGTDSYLLNDNIISITQGLNENESYFWDTSRKLIYQVGQDKACAYIIVEDVTKKVLLQALTVLKEAKLAIKNYFSNIANIRKSTEKFEEKFVEELLFKSNLNIRDIFKINKIELDMNKLYLVTLTEIDESKGKIDLSLLRSHILSFIKSRNIVLAASPIIWGRKIMMIVPALYKADTLELEPEWPRLEDSIIWQKMAEEKFKASISTGLGQPYPLRNLHKSYNEARFAITLPKLMGKQGIVQKFSELGQFAHIFSQDIQALKSYCLKTLASLLDYDSKSETELLSTLRILLDNCCNWKDTAMKMHIHVNTLHYRVDKIEQILNVNLSQMDTKADLFVAIKVLDTLTLLGFFADNKKYGAYSHIGQEQVLLSKTC